MTGASAKARGALEVILFEESRFRGSLMFTSAEVTVGNDPGVMVRLDDPKLAPCHAVVFFDGETCTVENYDEHTGTWVNGVPIERQELGPTDEIQIGRFRLRLTVHRADATPAPVMPRPPLRPALPLPGPATAPPTAKPSPPTTRPPSPPPPAAVPARPTPAASAKAAPPVLRPPSPPPPTAVLPTPPPPAASKVMPGLPAPGTGGKKTVKVAPARPEPPPSPAGPQPVPPVPAARPSSRMPTHPAPLTAIGSAPTALAVAAGPLEALTKLEPLPVPAKPALVSVPAVLPAPLPTKRTSTQPLANRSAAPQAPRGPSFGVTSEPHTVAPLLPSPIFDDDDDDDDDDAYFAPSFSLLDHLRASGAAVAPRSTVEVIRFRHGCIFELRHLHRGEKLRLHGMRKPVGRCSSAGGFVFHREEMPDSAAVSIDGQTLDESAWRSRADKRGRIALEPATQVMFPLPSGEGVLIHLVPAARPLPKSTWRPRLTKIMMVLAGVSLAVHLLVFTVLGLARLVRREYIADTKEGRFARIALKEVELEPPAPPPRPEKAKKKPKLEPSQTSSEQPRKVALLHPSRHRVPSTPQTQAAATAHKLLSALGSVSAGPKPLSATAMSNLDAVGPIRGGGFKVSGAIGRLPGDSLRLAAAGSGVGRLETRSANDVGKNLGRVLGRGPTGQVRAQVKTKPRAMKVEGHLDRGEIQRVINSHIHELQGCYERQLIVNPNLSGKVTFEWVIGTNGAVTVVRIKASTLSSNQATSCMQAAIRRWIFPRPSGGQVTVIYPIALASSGT